MTKTIENLTKAFIGESMARNRYTIYAKIALKEGYEQISELFLLTAENEREHAKWLFRMINAIKEDGNPTKI
ncbi:MAG: rubrerythrin family protein, partial [Candidatus Methanofastidiosa archaeon]|nr:rubrerythrin family protein [Candidatus Methanofastidiosa archaeon]